MRSYRRRARGRGVVSSFEVSLTPLIDTALTLLIIFMVTAPMMDREPGGIKIDLPEGKVQESKGLDQTIRVSVNKKGEIFLNGSQVAESKLIEKLKETVKKLSSKVDATVSVEGDKGASYGDVIRLVDKIKYVGGVKYVALATVHKE